MFSIPKKTRKIIEPEIAYCYDCKRKYDPSVLAGKDPLIFTGDFDTNLTAWHQYYGVIPCPRCGNKLYPHKIKE